MVQIPRDVVQTLVTKLDLKHATIKESRDFVLRVYGISLTSKTKEKMIREICKN